MTPGDIGDFCVAVSDFGAAIAAFVETQGMIAENEHRQSCGHSIAFGEGEFIAVSEKYGLQKYQLPGAKS